MLITKQEKEYKDILQMEKRRNEISKLLKDMPYYPLDKPVQRGWEVYIDLIPEIKRREDFFDIQQVMDIGYTSGKFGSRPFTGSTSSCSYISKVEWVKLIRAGQTGYFYKDHKGNIQYHNFKPARANISEKNYQLLPPQLKKYFTFDSFDTYYLRTGRKLYFLSHTKFPDYWTRIKVRPHFVTHYQSKGGKLEKEYEYLNEKIHEYFRLNAGDTAVNKWNKSIKNKYRASQRAQIRKFLKGESDDIVVKNIRHY